MRKFIFTSLAFLLLFPCLVSAKSIAVSETQALNDLLSSPERLYLTDILREEAVRALPAEQDWTIMNREDFAAANSADFVVQTQISKFGSSLVISAEIYESSSKRLVASYTGKGASVEDIERIIKEQSPSFYQKLLDQPINQAEKPSIGAEVAEVQIPQSSIETPPTPQDSFVTVSETQDAQETAANVVMTANDSLQPKADSSQLNEVQPKVAEPQQVEKPSINVAPPKEAAPVKTSAAQDKPKRFWGGITAGVTYNDYFSTNFGLNDIKPGKDYKLNISGADDLLNNFWGVGFKAGMSFMFIASPYFNLRTDLNMALRQGTGKTNTSVILSWKDSDKDDEKSDLEIEYSATQLNIDLPILARATLPNAIYFEAGPMFSFNVYSKSESKITDIYGTEKFEEKGGLNVFEFDIAAGLGISRNIGKSMLDFDLRFIFGMTRISDSNDSPKTWQGQLNITYWFL